MIIIMPKIILIILPLSTTPAVPAKSPKKVKTIPNPATKRIVDKISLLVFELSSGIEPNHSPTNPGISGKIQGEKNDKIPPKNATNILTGPIPKKEASPQRVFHLGI